MVTVHGRTVKQNKNYCGESNGDMIRDIASELSVPVVANGGIETSTEALHLMARTGVRHLNSLHLTPRHLTSRHVK